MAEYVSQKNESEHSLMIKNRDFSRIIHDVDKPIRTIASSHDKAVIKESLTELRKIISILAILLFSIPCFSQGMKDEIKPILDSFNFYMLGYDVPNARKYLAEIKAVSEKYKDYDTYFRAWKTTLGREAVAGNMELAIDESKRMKEEALKLNNEVGVVCAATSLADAYSFSRNQKKAKEVLEELINDYTISDRDLRPIYIKLYNSCISLNLYKDALNYLGKEQVIIESDTISPHDRHNSRFLDISLRYSDVFF